MRKKIHILICSSFYFSNFYFILLVSLCLKINKYITLSFLPSTWERYRCSQTVLLSLQYHRRWHTKGNKTSTQEKKRNQLLSKYNGRKKIRKKKHTTKNTTHGQNKTKQKKKQKNTQIKSYLKSSESVYEKAFSSYAIFVSLFQFSWESVFPLDPLLVVCRTLRARCITASGSDFHFACSS